MSARGVDRKSFPGVICSVLRTPGLARPWGSVYKPGICIKTRFLANVNVMSSSVRLSLSVTLVHATQAIEIFGNISMPSGTLAICWHPGKNFTEIVPRGTPPSGELNTTGVAEYSDFGPIERYISEKIGAKFVLITNRKSHMSIRLAPNSVTFNDLERRNSPNGRLISPNSVAFGANYAKVVEDTQYFLQRKSSFSDISFMAILAGDRPRQERKSEALPSR